MSNKDFAEQIASELSSIRIELELINGSFDEFTEALNNLSDIRLERGEKGNVFIGISQALFEIAEQMRQANLLKEQENDQ